jgi:hypothetical protein
LFQVGFLPTKLKLWGFANLIIKLKEKRIDLPNFDSVVRKYMPSGFDIHDKAIATSNIEEMYCAKAVD